MFASAGQLFVTIPPSPAISFCASAAVSFYLQSPACSPARRQISGRLFALPFGDRISFCGLFS
jgi:hypothetical protein